MRHSIFLASIACALFTAISVVGVCALEAQETLSVEVKATKLRKGPQLWAEAIADLAYGNELSVVEAQDSWTKVRFGKHEGYVHKSALTPKKIVFTDLKSTAKDIAFSPSEVNLAGKGFGRVVEDEYAQAGEKLNYTAVDLIEKRTSPKPSQLRNFLVAGQLASTL